MSMLRLRNTLTKQVEQITPIEPGRIGMYACGPTVYRPVHIGNLRSFLLADLIERVLTYHGLEVRKIMNITDVGHMTDELTDEGRDRMLLAVEDEGLSTGDIAAKYTEAFLSDTDAVNIRRAALYPKATDHIEQIIELIAKLMERNHAYAIDGTIYYDVTSFADYGKLSGQSLDAMQPGHRIEVDASKRNHQDFTLWVAAGPRRELVFDSPWGTGYPGWHIECSAMSLHYLGDRFDIHTGGVDNRFPHHEDEIAQSEGAVGHRVVQMWSHGEHLLMGQLKMAKSAGNIVTVQTLIDGGYDPIAFRYLCFTGRYRRQVHFTEEALEGAATALRRLREQMALLSSGGTVAATAAQLRAALKHDRALGYVDRFLDAVDDDLDLPSAITVLHEALGDDHVPPADRWSLATSWDNVLGLDLAGSGDLSDDLKALVTEREQARAARDFARADEIRDRLRAAGIELLDSETGTRWVRR